MQTASGLAAAHAQGLVHRDVKPANILLENGLGRVWLTDFGLARTADDASLTQSGVIAGTPQYMAPEQAQGHAVDHRADLFSLGSTLYAMCTAHAPFRAESAMAVLRRVCDEPARPVRTLNPDVPVWLAAIIDRLHAKSPADRFQTAAEVAELLGKCLAHVQEPDTHALPPNLMSTIPRMRNRRLFWAAAFLLTLGAAVPLGWSWLANQPNTDTPNADPSRAAPSARRVDANVAQAGGAEDSSLEAQIAAIRCQVAWLEADLTQPSVAGFGDPTAAQLLDARRRLDILERELVTRSP
jgi:serine/threonine protein kinase